MKTTEEILKEFAKQEAVKFANWLKKECYNYQTSFDTFVWRKVDDDITSYTSEEIYEQFKKEQDENGKTKPL